MCASAARGAAYCTVGGCSSSLTEAMASGATHLLVEVLATSPTTALVPAGVADLRAELGRRLALELDLAGEPVPLVGERLDLLATRVEPALQALAIRNGDRWVVAMPSLVQAHNQANFLNYLALTLAREVGLDPAASKDLKLPDGAAAYRMDTRRLAQRRFDAPPFECVRGKPLVPITSIGANEARTMATELARHLLARWPNMEGLPEEAARSARTLGPRALYQPIRNEWPEPVSPPADQALAAAAMAEFARQPWAAEADRAAARSFAIDTLASLRTIEAGEADPFSDMAACAATLLAARSLDSIDASWADAATRTWLRAAHDALRAMPAGSAATSAMACAALASDASPALVEAAWSADSAERVVMSSAWLLAADGSPPPDAAKAWKAALTPLIETQFTASIDGASAPDLDGGWSSGTAMPWPTAQSSRAALGLATALQRSGVIDASQRAQATQTLRAALRFLRQLQVDEDAAYAFRAPRRAMGGLRAAAWDSDQPMAASAYALLAAVRAAAALETADTRTTAPSSTP